MPSFIDAKNLQPYITKDLIDVINPIEYNNKFGKIVSGYKAEIIPLVCNLYLQARQDGTLTTSPITISVIPGNINNIMHYHQEQQITAPEQLTKTNYSKCPSYNK